MEPFIQTLFTMTAAATVAALWVMALRIPLKKAPRWITCALWLVVLFRMVCPVSFEAPVSLLPPAIVQETYTETVLSPDPAPAPAEPLPTAQAPAQVTTTVPEPQGISLDQVLFALWLTGAAGMLLWGAVSYVRLRRWVADGVRLAENVYESDRIDTPFVCGFFSPRIYLPVGLKEPDRTYVLLHEKAHIRRLDHLTKPLAWLALCPHWFNPLLHLAFRLFCRDVETACDQAVIRSFGKEDTIGYAEALLHLGRRIPLPQAVPLAFGEEDAKGRVKSVLDYKHPRVFVVLAALVVCALAGVVILANPGNRGEVLEGYGVTQVHALHQGLQVKLPQEMGEELVALLDEHGHEDYTYLAGYEAQEGILALTGQTDGTVYFFDPSNETLIRVNHDGYSAQRKKAPMNPSLAQDPDYLAWKEGAAAYLEVGRADALYAMKTPYAGDASAVGEILGAMNIREVVGDYTIELQTEGEPYGVTIHIARENPLVSFTTYYHAVGDILFALVDNLSTVSFYSEDARGTSSQSLSIHIFETEEALTASWGEDRPTPQEIEEQLAEYQWYKNLTQEEFRDLFDTLQASAARHLSQMTAQEYKTEEVLYLSPETFPGITQPGFYDQSTFTVAGTADAFSATLVNALSSAWPKTETFENAEYRAEGNLSLLDPFTEELGLEDETRFLWGEGWRIIDQEGTDTGYRYFTLAYFTGDMTASQRVYLVGHVSYSPEARGQVLDWLFRVSPDA